MVPGEESRRRRPNAKQAELGAFLRAQRARLQPADVGLPPGRGRRRTPGLRREEVAELAGVSITWYTWLEQGRSVPASAPVVDAIARALRLDPDAHRHLRVLAGLAVPQETTAPQPAMPRLRRLVDSLEPNAAAVYDGHFDYLAWNTTYVRLRHDPADMPEHRRNLLWMMFTDSGNRERMLRWEPAARAVLSQFRAAVGRHPEDQRFVELVAALRDSSAEFRTWWEEYPVREFRPMTIGIRHPTAGPIAFDLYQLRPVERPDLLVVVQVPTTPADAERVRIAAGSPPREGSCGRAPGRVASDHGLDPPRAAVSDQA